MMDSPLLAQSGPLDDGDTQSVLVKPTRAFAPVAPVAPAPKAPPEPVTLAPTQPSIVEKPRDYFSALQGQESGGNPFAKSKTSSAAGLYQFTDSTWRGVAARHPELGLTPDGRFDPAQEEKAVRAFTQDNAKILGQHDIAVNPGNLYIMHFMGEGAGPKFLQAAQASPAAPAASLFPKEAAANPTIFFEGGDPSKPRSLSQVYALQTKKFGGASVGETPTRVAMNDTGTMNDAGFTKMDFSDDAPFPAAKHAEKQDFSDEMPFPTAKSKPGEEEDPYGLITGPSGSALHALQHLYEIVSDPEKAITSGAQGIYELATHPAGTAKGVLAGAGQVAGGIGQAAGMLPGVPEEVGKESTEAVKRWREFGKEAPPGAEEIGYLGLSALPVSRAAELAGGAIKGSSMLANAARPVAEAAAGGTALGAIEPSVASTPGKQFAEKAEAAGGNILLGGGLGLGMGGAKMARGVPEMLRTASGAEAEAAIEGVRKTAVEKASEAVEAEKARAAEAERETAAKSKDLAKHEAELARIEKAQTELARREQKREAAGRNEPAGPTQEAELRSRVTARVRDRVRETERQAKEAGLSEEKAKEVAVEREKSRLAAEQATEDLAAAQAARPTLDSKEFGDQLQKAASAYAEKQDARLRKESGFKEAIDSAPWGRVVRTDKIKTYIADALKKTNDSNVESILKDARDRVREQTGVREVEGGELEPVYDQGINLEKADSLRKTLRTAYRKQDKVVENSTFADAAAARHVLNDLHRLLREAAVEAHPPYGEALEKYAEIARGGDIVKRGGDLKKVVAADDLSHEFTMNSGDVVGAIMSKTRGGSEALGKLISEKPELRDAARNYFNRELFGFDGAARKVSPEAMRGFLTRNEYALKDAGLWPEFSKLAEERMGASKAVETAKVAESEAKLAVKSATQQKKEVLDKLSEQQSLRSKAAKREELAYAPKDETAAMAKAAKEKADEAAKRLTAKAKPSEAAKKETQKSIDELAAKKQKAETAKKDYGLLKVDLEEAPPANMAGLAKTFAKKIAKDARITEDEYRQMVKDINTAETEFQKHQDAVRHRNNLLRIIAATTLGTFAAREGITHLRSGGIIP